MIENGWLQQATKMPTTHWDEREIDQKQINLLVIHNISLPPGKFGGPYISQLFIGTLDPDAHPYFEHIAHVRVSAHCLIRRDGAIIQYVPFDKRAWHAGVSCFQGRSKCNDFSIGIELEGTDQMPFTDQQYRALIDVTQQLQQQYPAIGLGNIVGHNDIAPGRKTDPGQAFDWARYRTQL